MKVADDTVKKPRYQWHDPQSAPTGEDIILTVRHKTIPGKYGTFTGYRLSGGEFGGYEWVQRLNRGGLLPDDLEVFSWAPMPAPDPRLGLEYREQKAKRDRKERNINHARRQQRERKE